MSGIFEEVGLSWNGQEHTVPADKVMGLIDAVEEHITIDELLGSGIRRVKLARAFAAALRYAGATKVSVDDIYTALFGDGALKTTTETINLLLTLMVPPEHIRKEAQQQDAAPKKPEPRKKSARGSSGRRT